MSDEEKYVSDDGPRRNFLVEFLTMLVGGAVIVFPFLAGLVTFLDPLRKRKASAGTEPVKIVPLEAIPDDGIPRQFPVSQDKTDAWTFSPNERVGAVFLVRQPGSDDVEAFNVVCPHAGCFVGYQVSSNVFQCPCHGSSFNLDGSIITPSPSPRGMDKLEGTKVNPEDGWVYVPFVNYYPGKHKKIEKK